MRPLLTLLAGLRPAPPQPPSSVGGDPSGPRPRSPPRPRRAPVGWPSTCSDAPVEPGLSEPSDAGGDDEAVDLRRRRRPGGCRRRRSTRGGRRRPPSSRPARRWGGSATAPARTSFTGPSHGRRAVELDVDDQHLGHPAERRQHGRRPRRVDRCRWCRGASTTPSGRRPEVLGQDLGGGLDELAALGRVDGAALGQGVGVLRPGAQHHRVTDAQHLRRVRSGRRRRGGRGRGGRRRRGGRRGGGWCRRGRRRCGRGGGRRGRRGGVRAGGHPLGGRRRGRGCGAVAGGRVVGATAAGGEGQGEGEQHADGAGAPEGVPGHPGERYRRTDPGARGHQGRRRGGGQSPSR